MNNRPLLIAHRGDTISGIENTVTACESALKKGATALEIDIRQSGSGDIVVLHDFSLKRLFSQPGYVGRTPLEKLKGFPYIQDTGEPEPIYINTLDEFLEQFGGRVPINLDAKTIHFFDIKFADKIISAIKRHNLIDSTWISCFNPFLLQILKLREQKIRTGYLFQRLTWLHTAYDRITWTDAWHPHFKVVNRNLIEKAAKLGKEVYVWTVNDPEVMQKIMSFNVNGIISDDVQTIKKSLL
ncbi:MAG: glycerophosphodiester phosphodiesterase [Calditrichales bacterium]|nr:MAG: glycerophosphodiester phosphodiesterase [Calditrichales bacterium]